MHAHARLYTRARRRTLPLLTIAPPFLFERSPHPNSSESKGQNTLAQGSAG